MAINIFNPPNSAPHPAEVKALVSLYQQGHYQDAQTKAASMTQQFPKHPLGWTILGAIYRSEKNNDAALPYLKKAAELLPRDANSQFNLANTHRDLGQADEAINYYQRALNINPALPHGFFHLGNMQHEKGFLAAAERSLRQALKYAPNHIETLSNLAHVLQDMGKRQDALAFYDQALALEPQNPLLHYNKGDLLLEMGQLNAAELEARTTLELAPQMPQAHAQMGDILMDTGDLDASITYYKKALELEPKNTSIHSNLLFALNYLPTADRRDRLEYARSYGKTITSISKGHMFQWSGEKNPSKLRVGIISADLRNHPVGYFIESIIANINPQKIELIALNTQNHEDDLTQRIKPYFKEWNSIAGISDPKAAQKIITKGLHIVLDLSGHTAGNRLSLFGYRLAPVQASWLGYFATTGVEEMDHLIADPVTLPVTDEHEFTEEIWRMPDTRLCFSAPREKIKPNALPALKNQGLTFGSFSNLIKLNSSVIQLWSKILHSLPTSRLLIQAKQLRIAQMKESILERFAAHGVKANQLILAEPVSRSDYLKAYHQVDVCLDPFPFPGGTTTAESLWMGVPVLTLQGDHFIARQGAGLLNAAGLADWIAPDPEAYHRQAVDLADKIDALAHLRENLRSQVLSSPLFDSKKFAKNLESALWGMWERKSQIENLNKSQAY